MQTQANTQAIHDGAHAAGAAAHAATLAVGGSQDDATRAFDEAAAAYVAARPVPAGHRASHVVVDEHDGYTFWRGADAALFDGPAARAFADQRNAEMKPEHARYRVYALVPDGAVTAATLLGDLFANCGSDREVYALEEVALSAGLLVKCQEEDCGAGTGYPGETCQACGELFSECAICVPGQCPGTDCPGNYGREDEQS